MTNWREYVDHIYQKYNLNENNTAVKYKASMKEYYKLTHSDFSDIFTKINDYMVKDGKVTDQIKNMNSVMRSETKNSMRQSYYIVRNDFDRIFDESNDESIIEHYDNVKKEPYFRWIHYYLGNGALGAGFNKQFRDVILNKSKTLIGEIKVFTIRCGENNKHYADFVNNKFISITWEYIDNISSMSYGQLKEYSLDKYPNSRSYTQFNTFINAMNVGDIVLIMKKGTKNVDIAVITSDVIFDELGINEYNNYRTIEILKKDIEMYFTFDIQSTITQIKDENRKHLIKSFFDDEVEAKYNQVMSNIDIDRNFVFEYSTNSKAIEEDDVEFNNSYQQLIIDGAPGTSKSYSLNKEITDNSIRHERVTFYQDYEYHNFVGSILPIVNDGSVSYEFVKGPFTKLLNDAFANPESKHYLVIEELTRGNAPAIFGDIFQLLDRDSDGWSRYPISNDSIFTSLDAEVQAFLNSNINFKGKVVLPPNFSIICTINSSDQNVYPLDTAFKRRFNYEIKSTEASNDFNNFDIYFGKEEDKLSVDWIKFQSNLNDYILNNLKLNEDKQVGPYFIKKSDTSASIQTKLAMYMWNDLQKVHTMNGNKIFNDKVKTLYKVDELFRTGSKEEIKAILTEEFIDKIGLK